MITNPDRQTRIAYHEAGHGVMAYLQQSPDFYRIMLEFKDGEWRGANEMQDSFKVLDNDSSSILWAKLLISRAGMVAEHLAFGAISSESTQDRAYSLHFAAQLALVSGEPITEYQKHIHQANIKAKEILTPQIVALSAVADKLLKDGVVSLDELAIIMERYDQ
jgi:ATP-dependent Zn protease